MNPPNYRSSINQTDGIPLVLCGERHEEPYGEQRDVSSGESRDGPDAEVLDGLNGEEQSDVVNCDEAVDVSNSSGSLVH